VGELSERQVEETLDATTRTHNPVRGYDERDVRLIMPDLVQSNVSALTKMKLGGRGHAGHSMDMRDERDSATCPLPSRSQSASHDRPETIGADGKPGLHAMPLLRSSVEHHGSGDDTAFVVQQLLNGSSLEHGCPCLARGGEQLMVENPPRNRKACRTKGSAGAGELPVRGCTPRTKKLHPFQGERPRPFETLQHAETGEDPNGLRAHVFRACLVSRERRPVDEDDIESRSRQ
jgi:hypothetical protein